MSRSGRPFATTTPKGAVLNALTVVPSPSPMTPASTSSFAAKPRSARRAGSRGAALIHRPRPDRVGCNTTE